MDAERKHVAQVIITQMRTPAALLLLFLQLRPFVGAAVCLHNLAAGTECPMPDHPDAPPERSPTPGSPHSSSEIPASGCPAAEFCMAAAPALAPDAAVVLRAPTDHVISALFTPRLHSTEPAAPPAPPPNA